MLTDTWFNTKTQLFDFDEDTYKAVVPLNFFDDPSLNGHFGVEFKIKNNKATVVITGLEDNPGVDVAIVINLIAMSIYENFLIFFEVKPNDVLWIVNKPTDKEKFNLSMVKFNIISPTVINGMMLITYHDLEWKQLSGLNEFIAYSQLHLL